MSPLILIAIAVVGAALATLVRPPAPALIKLPADGAPRATATTS